MQRTFKLGRFAVYDVLGRGGSGVVARATHLTTNVDVAVKFLSRRPDPERLRSFHKEVQAQARLAHPSIVYLYEYGDVDSQAAARAGGFVSAGMPFVAMELADQGTVRDIPPPPDWPSLRGLLVQVLDALAFSHARGVIHRDLKPENLLVFDEAGARRIKLADFGIAHAFTRHDSRDDTELSQFSGTPQYAAPEQIRGDWREFGPWTDLYSLGCVAWELICGRPPYHASNSLQTLMLQLDEPCPQLEPRLAVPEAMADWVRRAMSKEPSERFRSAAAAVRALPPARVSASSVLEPTGRTASPRQSGSEQRDVSTDWLPGVTTVLAYGGAGRAESSSGTRSPTSIDSPSADIPGSWRRERRELPAPMVGTGLELFGLRSIPFVGRDEERDTIWSALTAALEDRGRRAVFVSGESGRGKSRLVEWMAERADELGLARPIIARHSDAARDQSSGLSAAILQWCKGWGLGRAAFFSRLKVRLVGLTEDHAHARQMARALTEYVHPSDPDADQVDGPRYQFGRPRKRRETLAQFFELVATRHPLVLVIDDVQWSSEALALIEMMLERDTAAPMLILATRRTDARTDIDDLDGRLRALESHPSSRSLPLEALSAREHRKMLELMLPLEPASLDALVERTEGNPLFAIHLLDDLVDRGSLEMGADGFAFDQSDGELLPDDIHGLWQDRVDRLVGRFSQPADVRDAVEIAAALGRDVDTDEWRAATRLADIEQPDNLEDTLVESGLVQRGAQSWSFAHGMLVDSLARRSREAGRWPAHNAACVDALAEAYEGRRELVGRRIAEHLVEAGRPEEALDPLYGAYERALGAANLEQAREHLDRRSEILDALGVDAEDPRRIENLLAHGRIGTLTADWDLVGDVVDEALPLSRRLGADALVLKALHVKGNQHWRTGSVDEALAAFGEGLELAREIESDDVVRMLLSLGWAHFTAGHIEQAGAYFAETEAAARARGDTYKQLAADRGMAVVDDHLGRSEDALARLEKVIEVGEERGYSLLLSSARNALGDLYRFEGDYERAYDYAAQHARETARAGVNVSAQIALSNLAQVCIGMGRIEEAEEHVERLETDFAGFSQHSEDNASMAVLRLTLAAAKGEWEEVRRRLEPYGEEWPHASNVTRDHVWMLERAVEFAEGDAPDELAGGLLDVLERLRRT